MKTSKSIGILVLVLLLGACSTVGNLTGGMIGGMMSGSMDESGQSSDAETGGDTNGDTRSNDDADADSPYGGMAGSLTMLPPSAAFQIVYAQTTFFTAGYAPADDYSPGDGVRWLLTWRDEDGVEDSIETEQALLTRDADGSWWYISLASEDYRIEYEFFVDSSDTVVRLRYRDSEMSASREAEVSVPYSTGMYVAMEEDAESAGYRIDRTSERVSVPAGTWTAEKISITSTDASTQSEVDVTWWSVPEVPGDTVRFEFVPVTDENELYLGELQEVRNDYRPRL